MKWKLKTLMGAAAFVLASQAMAQIIFYEDEGFHGRTFGAGGEVPDFVRYGFNDRAASVVVQQGRWEVCEDSLFRGRCAVLRRGNYESLRSLGLSRRISSVRPVEDHRHYANEAPEPIPAPSYEFHRHPNERLFEVPVESVHAVVGPPSERCWVEHQQVAGSSQANIGGAIVGGLIGGILGHQVGGGSGKDLATAGGVVAGAVIGSNMASANSGTTSTTYSDVRRCENVASTKPEYWDVMYFFRGMQHHVQMTTPPGEVITVNREGEPRI